MRQRKRTLIALAALVLTLAAAVTAYAVSSYGTKDDPLVTKSYLDEVLQPQLLEEFEDMLSEGAGGADFRVVTLQNGQTLSAEVGCEVMLRIGSASASGPDSPVLVDTTSGTTLENGGAMVKNHLYMITIVNNGLKATANGTTVLVSGSYTVK